VGQTMISSGTRMIQQYCSVCKATLEMAVVDTVQDHDVTWLKCPRCNGILPHMLSREEEAPGEVTPAAPVLPAPPAAPPTAIPEAERAGARDYDPNQTYQVGEIVYHRSFNQFGRVLEKTQLAGKRAVIRVQFETGEPLHLREGQ
jgi:hypothetical protein